MLLAPTTPTIRTNDANNPHRRRQQSAPTTPTIRTNDARNAPRNTRRNTPRKAKY